MADIDEPVENSSPESSPTPPMEPSPEPAETEASTPLAQTPESEPVPEPTQAEKAKAWDHDRQKRDEERAARQKTLEDELAAIKAREKARDDEIAVLKASKAAPAQPPPPSLDEIQKMRAQRKAFADPANSQYDPEKAVAIQDQIEDAILDRQKVHEERIKTQETREAEAASREAFWRDWKKTHPECDSAKAQSIFEDSLIKFGDRYQGQSLGSRALEELDARIEETKGAKSPPKPTTVRQTAVRPPNPASVSAPAGTRVVPANSGARPAALTPNQAYYDALTQHMREIREGRG